jgi:hypothetical protein
MVTMNNYCFPNFFIVGASKCGTTALSEYLRGHPAVFIAERKELHYFCLDFNLRYPRARTLNEYLSHFRGSSGKRAIGEASPWYLYSECAIEQAYAFNPNARFIAMVRNPIDMVPSLHRQLLNNFDEDQQNVLKAWRLQTERNQGRCIPASCREPKVLQYCEVCTLGRQVKRLFSIVPSEKRLVIVLEDLKLDPRAIYRQVLSFLKLEDDGRTAFPILNEAFRWRFQRFSQFVYATPRFMQLVGGMILRALGRERLGLFRVLDRLNDRFNRKAQAKQPLPIEFKEELRSVFAEDIKLLGRMLNRDLSGWLQ